MSFSNNRGRNLLINKKLQRDTHSDKYFTERGQPYIRGDILLGT